MKHIKKFKVFESEEHEEDMDIDTSHEEEDMEITQDEDDEEMDIDYDTDERDEPVSKPSSYPTRKHTESPSQRRKAPEKHEPYLGADVVKTFRRLRGFHY